jgi:hypothetical protein
MAPDRQHPGRGGVATAAATPAPEQDLRSCDQSVTSRPSETPEAILVDSKTAGQTGGPPGDRTQNPRIKSPLLCQLS